MNKHDSGPDWFAVLESDWVFLIALLAPIASLGIRGRTKWNGVLGIGTPLLAQ